MKKASKNEPDILGLINKIQEQLNALDKKIDTLINRPVPEAKPAPKPPVNNPPRTMHTAICADCKKECTVPFKPSGDRPIYCQDCFSRRKVIRLSGISVQERPKIEEKKKKAVTKKKAAPKKK